MDPAPGQLLGNLDHDINADCARQDHDGAFIENIRDSGPAEEHLMELGTIPHSEDHGVNAPGGRRSGVEGSNACRRGQRESRLIDIEAVHPELTRQAGSHGQAHRTESEHGNRVVRLS
jgi:hypothetical protein